VKTTMRDITDQLAATGMTEEKLTALIALSLDRTPETITCYAIAVVTGEPGEQQKLAVISSLGPNRKAAAVILRHAAEHMLGRCRRCTGREKRAIRGNSQ